MAAGIGFCGGTGGWTAACRENSMEERAEGLTGEGESGYDMPELNITICIFTISEDRGEGVS